MTEAAPNAMPNRTHIVHMHKRRSEHRNGASDTSPYQLSGSGEIRTHGTLSRTHTFQTGDESRFCAHVLRDRSPNLRDDACRSNDRGCASNRMQTVRTAHCATCHQTASKTAPIGARA